jgi:hypothetical protein
MIPIQKQNFPIAILSIVGGVCLAVSITNIITDKPDYPVIAQAIIFTGWLVLCFPILYILIKNWVAPRLTGISRRDLVVHIVLTLSVSALIVFTTPISHQLYSPRKVSLEINATTQKNSLAIGNEIGILSASMDGVVIPWSEFSWGKNWDKIEDRPYFHDVNPAQLIWQGNTKEGLLSLSLISSSSTGILEVKLNGEKHTYDSYEESKGSIKQVDFPAFQKDWRWAAFSLTFIMAIGILIFIGTLIPRSFFVIPLVTGAILVNVTVFQKISPLPPLRLLLTNEIDLVGITDHMWDPNGAMAVYLYPSLRGTTLISTPELIIAFSEASSPNKLVSVHRWLKRLLALKEYKLSQYDYLLSSDELAILEQEPSLEWDLPDGGKFVVFPHNKKNTYVLMKSNRVDSEYYFVPMEIATGILKRNIK